MRTVLKVGAVLAFLVAAGAYPLAWIVDRQFGRDVLVVSAVDEGSVAANRYFWEEDGKDPSKVPSIYGTPSGVPVRVAFVEEGKVLRPPENPDLALYLKRGDDHPVQVQTFHFAAPRVAIGALLAGIACLLLAARVKKEDTPS